MSRLLATTESTTASIEVHRPRWESVYRYYTEGIRFQSSVTVRVRDALGKALYGASWLMRNDNSLLRTNGAKELKDWLSGEDVWRRRDEEVSVNMRLNSEGRQDDFNKNLMKKMGGHDGIIIIESAGEFIAALWKMDKVIHSNIMDNIIINGGTVYFWRLLSASRCGINHHRNVRCPLEVCYCSGNIKGSNRIHQMLGCCHYKEIRTRIYNTLRGKFGSIGRMLNGLWNRYEGNLIIHSTNHQGGAMFGYQANGRQNLIRALDGLDTPGVQINIGNPTPDNPTRGLAGSENLNLMPYQVIIHELFHNIEYLAIREIAADVAKRARLRELRLSFARSVETTVMSLRQDTVVSIYESRNAGLIDIVAGGRCNYNEWPQPFTDNGFPTPNNVLWNFTRELDLWYSDSFVTCEQLELLGYYNRDQLLTLWDGYGDRYLPGILRTIRNQITPKVFVGMLNPEYKTYATYIYNCRLADETFANMITAAIVDLNAFNEMNYWVRLHTIFEKYLKDICSLLGMYY
jgi:hypothetical protein